ncbi:MAG: hypothetical protein WC140_07400 [Bacteroidales bacterium]
MKKITLLIVTVFTILISSLNTNAQDKFRIGQYCFNLRSPLEVEKIQSKVKITHFNRYVDEKYIELGAPIEGVGKDSYKMNESRSSEFTLGYRMFYHPCQFFGFGPEIHWTNYTYRLNNGSTASLGFDSQINPTTIRKEFLKTHALGVGLNTRYHFFHTNSCFLGDSYLVIGGYFDLVYASSYKVKYWKDNGHKAKRKYRNNELFTDYHYGIRAEISFDDIALYTKYRLNRCFKKSTTLPLDSPQMTLGMTLIF